jgi:hypothetical protein
MCYKITGYEGFCMQNLFAACLQGWLAMLLSDKVEIIFFLHFLVPSASRNLCGLSKY